MVGAQHALGTASGFIRCTWPGSEHRQGREPGGLLQGPTRPPPRSRMLSPVLQVSAQLPLPRSFYTCSQGPLCTSALPNPQGTARHLAQPSGPEHLPLTSPGPWATPSHTDYPRCDDAVSQHPCTWAPSASHSSLCCNYLPDGSRHELWTGGLPPD